MKIFTYDDIPDNIPDVNCIVKPGILPEGGRMMIVGDPEAGKTWLSLRLAYDIASGRPWLGYYPTKRSKVLHLALEDWERLAAPRWSKLKKQYPDARGFFHAASQPGLKLDTPQGENQLLQSIGELNIEVIVVDTWRAAVKGDENASETSDNFYMCFANAVNRIEISPPSIVLNHHKSKPFLYYDREEKGIREYDKGMHAQRGSLDLEAKQDTIIELIRTNNEQDFRATLKFTKAKQSKVRLGQLELKFDSDRAKFNVVKGNTTAISILELLKIRKKVRIAELVGELNKSRPTIDLAADFLSSAGLIKTSGSTKDRELSLSDNL